MRCRDEKERKLTHHESTKGRKKRDILKRKKTAMGPNTLKEGRVCIFTTAILAKATGLKVGLFVNVF
jgi:hypothetical protein